MKFRHDTIAANLGDVPVGSADPEDLGDMVKKGWMFKVTK